MGNSQGSLDETSRLRFPLPSLIFNGPLRQLGTRQQKGRKVKARLNSGYRSLSLLSPLDGMLVNCRITPQHLISRYSFIPLGTAVQWVDKTIHRINCCPLDTC